MDQKEISKIVFRPNFFEIGRLLGLPWIQSNICHLQPLSPPHHGVQLQKLPSPKWRNWRRRFKVNKPLYWGMRFDIKDMEQYGNAM